MVKIGAAVGGKREDLVTALLRMQPQQDSHLGRQMKCCEPVANHKFRKTLDGFDLC